MYMMNVVRYPRVTPHIVHETKSVADLYNASDTSSRGDRCQAETFTRDHFQLYSAVQVST